MSIVLNERSCISRKRQLVFLQIEPFSRPLLDRPPKTEDAFSSPSTSPLSLSLSPPPHVLMRTSFPIGSIARGRNETETVRFRFSLRSFVRGAHVHAPPVTLLLLSSSDFSRMLVFLPLVYVYVCV